MLQSSQHSSVSAVLWITQNRQICGRLTYLVTYRNNRIFNLQIRIFKIHLNSEMMFSQYIHRAWFLEKDIFKIQMQSWPFLVSEKWQRWNMYLLQFFSFVSSVNTVKLFILSGFMGSSFFNIPWSSVFFNKSKWKLVASWSKIIIFNAALSLLRIKMFCL